MRYLASVIGIVAIIGLTGCSTVPGAGFARTIALEGIVYTGSGAPLRDAEITLEGRAPVWSDVDGRFTIPRVKPGAHRVHAHHDTHEAVELTMSFLRPTDILYLRLYSGDDLVRESQQALERGETSKAEELIARALVVDPDSIRIRYLAAIVYMDARRLDDARVMLDHPVFDSASPAVRLLAERLAEEDSR